MRVAHLDTTVLQVAHGAIVRSNRNVPPSMGIGFAEDPLINGIFHLGAH
jgi:hypothetical protein